jgi:hypothetical protein
MVACKGHNRKEKGTFKLSNINSAYVDFVKTWGKGILIAIEPKMTRANREDLRSPMVQASDGNGNLRWTVAISVPTKVFETTKHVGIEVTINASKRPYEAIPIGSNIIVEGMLMGIMKADKTGYSTFFSAENIKPVPPERPAAGQ